MSKKQLPKTAFITGAAAGIGREYTLECASRGIGMVCADINGDGLVIASQQVEQYGILISGVTPTTTSLYKRISFKNDTMTDQIPTDEELAPGINAIPAVD